MFEKLVYDSLYSHLVSCDLPNPNQSGFHSGDLKVNHLISITDTILEAFDCNPSLDFRSGYLDISKAFDRVWHDGLIYKLKPCGVSGKLLSLIQSGKCSSWGDISAGVSYSRAFIFLVYINDLSADLKCNVKLFADDKSLFTVVREANKAASDMNHNLQLIREWAHDWRINPDPQKQAVELLFSRKEMK